MNPWVSAAISTFVAAEGFGSLVLVASIAVGSSIVNYYLNRRGKVLTIKLLNRGLWIAAGIIFINTFFSILGYATTILHL